MDQVRIVCWLIATVLLCAVAIADQQSPSPREAIAHFCLLDAKGARTDSRLPVAKEVNDLDLWMAEPGWDTVVVISSYRIESVQRSGQKALVTVTYATLGKMAISEWEETGPIEEVRFELKYGDQHWTFPDNADPILVKAKRRWRITDPVLMPHVSLSWAISRVKRALIEEQDPREKEKAASLLNRLQAIRKLHPAAL